MKAVEDLQEGKPLQTCNAQDLDNVVCCEPEEKLPYMELVSKNSESVVLTRLQYYDVMRLLTNHPVYVEI